MQAEPFTRLGLGDADACIRCPSRQNVGMQYIGHGRVIVICSRGIGSCQRWDALLAGVVISRPSSKLQGIDVLRYAVERHTRRSAARQAASDADPRESPGP